MYQTCSDTFLAQGSYQTIFAILIAAKVMVLLASTDTPPPRGSVHCCVHRSAQPEVRVMRHQKTPYGGYCYIFYNDTPLRRLYRLVPVNLGLCYDGLKQRYRIQKPAFAGRQYHHL